jgi:hypothetical protein
LRFFLLFEVLLAKNKDYIVISVFSLFLDVIHPTAINEASRAFWPYPCSKKKKIVPLPLSDQGSCLFQSDRLLSSV